MARLATGSRARSRSPRATRVRARFRWAVGLAVTFLVLVTHTVAADTSDGVRRPRPEYRWVVDGPILGVGAATWLTGIALDTDVQSVPPTGLDPSSIHLTIDRNIVGHHDTDADAASNYFRDAAAIYPMALAVITAPGGSRERVGWERAGLYAESLVLAHGIVFVSKVGVSRPRPFTYLSASERPDHSKYRVESSRAFQSMPSGHAATVWCATGFAVTDHLMSHPDAGWVRNAAVAFGGSLLATTTSALRVEAGQHFPTDTMVGGLIGVASGTSVPLLHRWFLDDGPAPLPSAHAWLQSGAGAVVGIGVGLLLTSAFGR